MNIKMVENNTALVYTLQISPDAILKVDTPDLCEVWTW